MHARSLQGKARLIASLITLLGILVTHGVSASTSSYTYDELGRLTTIIYVNGVGVSYTYDANGNQTSSSIVTCGTGPLTWGTGLWGCSIWQAQ